MSPSENRPVPSRTVSRYTLQTKTARDTFIRISITAETGNELLKGTATTVEEFIQKSLTNPPGPLPVIKGKNIAVNTSVKTEVIRVRNVIGIIEGESSDEFIVLGAHYDHLGTSDGYIWNGADDNGSGAVGVLTIAKAIMETGARPRKTIIVALWTAEEEGLLGSRYFVQNLPFPKSSLLLNINFDMISRYVSDEKPKAVTMTYTDSKPVFREITENNLKRLNIDLDVEFQPSDDPPGGSDHRSFVEAGIPVLRFKPGHREEYHTPYDETDTINWDIMEKIIRLCFADVWDLAAREW
jgi:Zn-dependent M28 family amino/carboxypeptidase